MSPAPILPLPSEVETCLLSQEDADMERCFDFHKAEEEMLSLWPLHDEPLLACFKPKEDSKIEDCKPVWDEDPPTLSLLWRRDCDRPVHIEGPRLPTSIFGRSVAEVFADFPTNFPDSPSTASSPTLSPPSPQWSTIPLPEEDVSSLATELSDPSVDEMTKQLIERIHIDSPPSPPLPLSPPDLLPFVDDVNNVLPSFTFACNPLLTFNSPSLSSGSTLSVGGTSSSSSSTYAVSPTPTAFGSPPAPEKRRSPRKSPRATACEVVQLEEYIDPRPRKQKALSKPTFPCPVPGCTESFTRRNDVMRHVKTAAIHKGTVQRAEALAAANAAICKYCGQELSRGDSARRHELTDSCGKRTIRMKSTHAMLPVSA